MRRAMAALSALALIVGVVPAAGAISDAGPDTVSWVETHEMGAWVILEARDKCIEGSWIQSHMTFFRGGTGDEVLEDPFENAGTFEAVEDGSATHTGDIWWVVSGRTRLEPMNPSEPCNPEYGFPVQGEFHGKGMLRITESEGSVDREDTTCRFTMAIHLTGDPTTLPFPTLEWTGNSVGHCDDGAKIHGTITGPIGDGLETGGITQVMTGVIHDKER